MSLHFVSCLKSDRHWNEICPLQDNWYSQSLGRPHGGNGALFIIHTFLYNWLTSEDYTMTYPLLKTEPWSTRRHLQALSYWRRHKMNRHDEIPTMSHIWDILGSLLSNHCTGTVCLVMISGVSRVNIIPLMLAFYRSGPFFSVVILLISPVKRSSSGIVCDN